MTRIVSVALPMWAIECRTSFRGGSASRGSGRNKGGGRTALNAGSGGEDDPNLGGGQEGAGRPFALVESGPRGIRLAAVNRAALAAGVAAGDALADARAIHPGLTTAPATPAGDRARLRALARWLGRYGINRNAYGFIRPAADDYPVRCYGLWVDISGVAHLYGGEARLLADLDRRLDAFGLTAQTGLADTLGAAHALAWHAARDNGDWRPDHRIAPAGETLTAIAHLPVGGLRLEAEPVRLLRRLGLATIGALAAVPRGSIERRFHARDAGRRVLLRLDQATGAVREPRRPIGEPLVLAVEALFAEPLITSDGLIAETGRLVARLAADLEPRALGVRALRLVVYRSDGTIADARIGTSSSSVDPDHLMRLIGEKIAALDLGFGADMLVLEAVRAEPLSSSQSTSSAAGGATRETGDRYARLVDRLANRLGAAAVIRLRAVESHWPERSVTAVPALEAGAGSLARNAPSRHGSRAAGDASWHVAGRAPRPALLFAPPEPIDVVADVTDGAPARFIWRRVVHRVAAAAGPERIEPEWWRDIGAAPRAASARNLTRTRDYFRLEDRTGARFWVFRAGRYGTGGEDREDDDAPPAWFLHGIFA